MKKLNFLFFLLLLLPQVIFSQESYTPLQTNSGEVIIPGKWQQLNTAEDSGQTYLKNSDNVIIAIAKNPKRAYPFYAKEKSDFENVIAFYKWDADYRESLNFLDSCCKSNVFNANLLNRKIVICFINHSRILRCETLI